MSFLEDGKVKIKTGGFQWRRYFLWDLGGWERVWESG
jgi:hypothetical protein